MPKVNLLFTIPNFITAGSGREMLNIIYRLDKDIFDITIAVEKEGGALFEEVVSKGIKIIIHPFTVSDTGMLAIIKGARQVALYYTPYHFDVWQSFNWSSDFSEALIAKFAGAKYVYVKKNMNWDRAAWKVKSFLSRAIIARNTTLLRTVLFPPYLRRKTHYITGGVDTTVFVPIVNKIARTEFNIPHNVFLITCVAQLVRPKDQVTLIKAVAERKNVYVVLAGAAKDEVYTAELYTLIQELQLHSRVVLAGPVSDINKLLNNSDAFVLPTTNIGGHEEGCPVALLEAMSAGVPCIASNVAGNRDLIITNQTGLLFSPGNVTELMACIEKYMNDSSFAKQMATAGREMVLLENTLDIEAAAFRKSI